VILRDNFYRFSKYNTINYPIILLHSFRHFAAVQEVPEEEEREEGEETISNTVVLDSIKIYLI